MMRNSGNHVVKAPMWITPWIWGNHGMPTQSISPTTWGGTGKPNKSWSTPPFKIFQKMYNIIYPPWKGSLLGKDHISPTSAGHFCSRWFSELPSSWTVGYGFVLWRVIYPICPDLAWWIYPISHYPTIQHLWKVPTPPSHGSFQFHQLCRLIPQKVAGCHRKADNPTAEFLRGTSRGEDARISPTFPLSTWPTPPLGKLKKRGQAWGFWAWGKLIICHAWEVGPWPNSLAKPEPYSKSSTLKPKNPT